MLTTLMVFTCLLMTGFRVWNVCVSCVLAFPAYRGFTVFILLFFSLQDLEDLGVYPKLSGFVLG